MEVMSAPAVIDHDAPFGMYELHDKSLMIDTASAESLATAVAAAGEDDPVCVYWLRDEAPEPDEPTFIQPLNVQPRPQTKQEPAWERLHRSARPSPLARPAICFDVLARRMYWMRLRNGGDLVGSSVVMTVWAADAAPEPTPRAALLAGQAAQAGQPLLALEIGAGGVIGPFGFAEGLEGPVEILATLAGAAAPLVPARLVFFPRTAVPRQAEPPYPPGYVLEPLPISRAPAADLSPSSLSSPPSDQNITPPTSFVTPPSSFSGPPSKKRSPPSKLSPEGLPILSEESTPVIGSFPLPLNRRRPREEESQECSTEELLDRAAENAEKTVAVPHGHAFMNQEVLSGLASLTLGSDDLAPTWHQRPRIEAEAPSASAAVCNWKPEDLSQVVTWSTEGGQRQDFVFLCRRQRCRYEENMYAAIRQLDLGTPTAPTAFVRALVNGPILDTRFVSTLLGQRELRRSLPMLRAATRSMAAEQTATTYLMRSAVCSLMYFSRTAPRELAAACERTWRLADALVPPNSGVALSLSFVPMPQIVQLAKLAVDLLEAYSEEDPASYVEALSQLGYRYLQNLQDEEACKVFNEAWTLSTRRKLSPCRAECRAIRGLVISYSRRFMLEKAAAIAPNVYWFEESTDPVDVRIKIGCIESIMRVAVIRRDWPTASGMLATYRHLVEKALSRDDPDYEIFDFCVSAYHALYMLHCGRYMDFLAYYRKAVKYIRDRPATFAHPILDVCGSMRATPVSPRNAAAGLRHACRLQRVMDMRSTTPLLAHLLHTLAQEHEKCGEPAKAASVYREALKEYERFPTVFPPDHPRILSIKSALETCALSEPPPSPNAFTRIFSFLRS